MDPTGSSVDCVCMYVCMRARVHRYMCLGDGGWGFTMRDRECSSREFGHCSTGKQESCRDFQG